MITVFWDSHRRCELIYIDYLEKGKTVTGFYYAELLGRFDAELQKKRSHLGKKKCSSTMATVHTSAVATVKLIELGY